MRTAMLALIVVAGLAGCLGDGTDNTPDPTTTTEPTPMPEGGVTSFEHIARLMDTNGTETTDDDAPFPSGSGIWVHNGYAYGSALGAGFFIADVRDPTNPALVYRSPSDSVTDFSRDADVAVVDGRTILVLATQQNGMHIYDVTDPVNPVLTGRVLEDVSNHNIAVVPGTPFVFNSRSGGAGSTNDLVDLSNPDEPIVIGAYGTHGCHDIAFHQSEGKFRGYCAGIQRTEIWNMDGFDVTADEFGITVAGIVSGLDSPIVGNPAFGSYPVRTLHHLAMVNHDASILIIGDEHNGGGSPGMCLAHEETTGLSTPLGALWFYDISDEANPQLLSWFSPPTVEPAPIEGANAVPNCTAHFGTLVAGEDKLAMAWYSAGVVLIDFTDASNPKLLDQFQEPGINTWDARIVGEYVFTGDITRGMDVLKLA